MFCVLCCNDDAAAAGMGAFARSRCALAPRGGKHMDVTTRKRPHQRSAWTEHRSRSSVVVFSSYSDNQLNVFYTLHSTSPFIYPSSAANANANAKQQWYIPPSPSHPQSLLLVILLTICTSTYAHYVFPGIIDRNKDTYYVSPIWKAARVGERLSPYVSIACVVMAVSF